MFMALSIVKARAPEVESQTDQGAQRTVRLIRSIAPAHAARAAAKAAPGVSEGPSDIDASAASLSLVPASSPPPRGPRYRVLDSRPLA
jgi:hypothetical protein